jgi:putative inner membrane exporter YdcZ
MSGGTALAVVMSLSAGFAGSVQAAVLGRLGDRVGTVEAVGFSTLVAGATGIAVLLVARRSLHGVETSFHQPLWLWLGGILSAFIVLSITFAAPKIGVAAAIGRARDRAARGRRCAVAQEVRPTMSSGRTGTRLSSRPLASRSAETIAAVETTVGGSPTPLRP